MDQYLYDLNPVQHIVADAVGEPGNRTFYLQARQGSTLVSLIVEKQQVASLAASVLQMLDELVTQNPDLAPAVAQKNRLKLELPLESLFRVGQMGLGYDEEQDLVVIVAQGVTGPTDGGDDLPMVRFFVTRSQMRSLSEQALKVVEAGRPECPLCGRPIDPGGHFCPRTDGHAFPLVM